MTSRHGASTGFTLVEMMMALAIGTIVSAGATSSFLLLGRTAIRVGNYHEMAKQTSGALERFAQDVRMGSDITWNSSSSITLTVPDNYAATGNSVTYAWEPNPAIATFRCFYVMPGTAADSNARVVLLREVTAFNYARFNRLDAPATTDPQIKRIQINMTTSRSSVTTVKTSNEVVSASYILRNKQSI